MTKPLKPGQLCTINKKVYRAKKEIISGTCVDCDIMGTTCFYMNLCLKHNVILQEVKIKKRKSHTQS